MIAVVSVVFATLGVIFSVEDMLTGVGFDCLGSGVPKYWGQAFDVLISAAVGIFISARVNSVVMGVTAAVYMKLTGGSDDRSMMAYS